MNILHLISSGGMYGAEAVILTLSHELQRFEHQSSLAVFANANQKIHERASAEGFLSGLIPCKGQLSSEAVRAIRNQVQQQKIDVLHAHGYKADLYAWAALRNSDLPLVSTCHTWYDNDLAVRMYGVLDRRVLRNYTRVVAVSTEVQQRLLASGVQAARIQRIHNGIDLRPFTKAANNRGTRLAARDLRVGLVGRLSQEKGIDVFIKAAGIVTKTLPEVRFIVIGEGPDRSFLEAQIRRLGLEDRVTLAGHQEFMSEVYAKLDVMVSASRQEGMPMALLEGMASGLPLVGTSVGEVATLILPGETGLLVASNDAEALAAAMQQVLEDAGKRLVFGQNARRRIEQEFSARHMADEYSKIYTEALQDAKARP